MGNGRAAFLGNGMTKIELRNLWFKFHKWIGLLLAIAIIPLCVTGSALVWDKQFDKLMHPGRYAVSGTAGLPAQAYAVAAAKALQPGERLSQVTLPAEEGEPVIAQAARPGPVQGRPVRTMVYLDPADARVLEVGASNASVTQIFHQIHGSLMIPGAGRQIVGWVGVAMLISSMTGLWLWWPTVGSWLRGLRWRRHRDFDTNLHHLFGFWIAVPLFILSLTGAWISFPGFFGQFGGAQASPAAHKGPSRAQMMRAKPLPAPATPLDAALGRALAVAPGKVDQISWPTDLRPEWQVRIATEKGGSANAKVIDASGAASAEAGRGGGGEQRTVAQWMRAIHDGHDMPFLWQLIVFLGGLLPAILSITGLIMWWRARSWRGAVQQRKQAVGRVPGGTD
jgi:uncharacterized iron-regulated membrane protein